MGYSDFYNPHVGSSGNAKLHITNSSIYLPIQHFINKIHMIVRTPLEHALEDISEGLVRPHLASHPKPIQVNIETITRCLETLTKHLTRQDGDNENSKS